MKNFAGSASENKAKKIYQASLGPEFGRFKLGENTSAILARDPKLLLFTLSRYKFVSKLFAGFASVLEVGCQEAWGAPIVAKEVGHLHGIDFYVPYIDSCEERFADGQIASNLSFEARDILESPLGEKFDGIFALDVLEHILPSQEDLFMRNTVGSLSENGSVVIGMPSIESQAYASEASRLGHVNCKSGPEFVDFARKYFGKVNAFCMNDEVLHTGFFPMAQYLFVVCSNPLVAK